MMTTLPSIVLPVFCSNEECGMQSVFEFWPDGSFKRIVEACHHTKTFPTREVIRVEMTRVQLEIEA